MEPDAAAIAPAASIPQQAEERQYEQSDIFAWANNLFEFKEDLQMELFLLGKTGMVYRAKLDSQLQKQLQPLFVDELLEHVLAGAAEGMVVRGFEEAEAEEHVLQRTPVANVEKLVEAMNWILNQEHEIETFVEEEHDLRRIRGIIARCRHAGMKPFYVIKVLPTAQLLKGTGAWMASGNQFVPFQAAAGLKIPADNQLLIVDHDLYVFNQAKLERLFGYNAKKASIAEQKVRQIEAKFKLSFAEGEDLQTMVKGNKAAINKLQKLQLTDLNQDKLMDHAEELGIDLMVDESGAIIIMNAKDLNKFVNLLNDDYVESALTGMRYEIRSKRPLRIAQEDTA